MKPSNFSFVLPELQRWQQELIVRLRQPEISEGSHLHATVLAQKLQVDSAIGCLEVCQKFNIGPRAQVLILPPTKTQTPSSEYRIVEDHESDNREWWQELQIDDEPIRLREGDRIVR